MRLRNAHFFSTASRRTFLIAVLAVLQSCASPYYYQHYSFNQEFERGDLRKALETLQSDASQGESRARFVWFVNNGLLLSILGKYSESNEFFERAFLFGEDYRINYLQEASSYLTNPNVTVYRGEDHEHLMLLYFKAINYLKMNEPENALIECRRLNIRLNQLSDKYTSDQKFSRDAFVHTLMGIIYQSTKDYNNAFIAYRNAVEIYESDYASFFAAEVPDQLKTDLLNTAYWTGFNDEFERYAKKFGLTGYKPSRPDAELVFFWHNGLAPVKDEWSINFAISQIDANTVVFSNPDLGLTFPFHVEEDEDKRGLAGLEIFRVAFPRYLERPAYFQQARIRADSVSYDLQLAEDVSKIAFYSLDQRMTTEFAKGLLRAALKKATEHSIRKEDERLGALIGVVNAITERADTRNWQTLPHSIHYARVPLHVGDNPVTFSLHAGEAAEQYNFNYRASAGQTLFHTFSSLESQAPVSRPFFNSRLTRD